MLNVVLVGLGGAVGSMLRYGVSAWVMGGSKSFPYGTLAVNAIGCFAIGLILGLAETHDFINSHTRLLLTTGLLGGFTTFSAFGFETFALLRDDRLPAAFANIAVQLIVGLLAVWAGHQLSRAFGG
ncbi:MAG: fluoride efflux transporter CrcB [Chloroflexi bacterium]|nr:fluoride efflux transporter CrcB [Chloroflexota bacterium]